jgi:hypothetical protein
MSDSTRDGAMPARATIRPQLERAVTFVNEGARVRVEANSSRAVGLIERVLPVGSRLEQSHDPDVVFALSTAAGIESDGASHHLYRNSTLLESSPDLDVLLQRLESELHFAVASNARSALFVHAGVVAWEGQAILLPGPSMSGKSSLVAALLRAGAEYYSDEYAVIDGQGHVHPYAKPLLLRSPEGRRCLASPQSQGCRIGTRPLLASLIVSTRYSPGEHFQPAACGPSRGLMILVANTLLIRERPRFALDHLMPIADGATTLEGVRGDADEAAGWLLRYRILGSRHGRLSKAR